MKYIKMAMEQEKVQEFVGRVMYTQLFSMNEKFKIIEKLKNNDLSEDDINQILDLIKRFDEWILAAANRYYRNMDTVYAQYLDKNILHLRQSAEKITLEVKEVKMNEKDWDPDLILNQIE